MSIQSIGVHVKVRNFEASKQFYSNLGFKKIFSYGPDQKVTEDYSGSVFAHNNCKLEIADGHRAVKKEVFKERISSPKISLMITVDSLQEIIRRSKKYSIPIAVSPRHYYWGTLELVIKDPDGTVLVFICPYSEQEAKKIKADEKWSKKKY